MRIEDLRPRRYELSVTELAGTDEAGEPVFKTILNSTVSPLEMITFLMKTVEQHPDGGFDPSGIDMYYWKAENGNERTLLIVPVKE